MKQPNATVLPYIRTSRRILGAGKQKYSVIWSSDRSPKFQFDLKASPRGPIEQLGVVGSGDENAVGRKIVKLQKKGGHDPLDFAGFVKIAAFLSDRVEFIEEEDTRFGAHEVEKASEPLGGFTQIARHHCVVSERQTAAAQVRRRDSRRGKSCRFLAARQAGLGDEAPGRGRAGLRLGPVPR